MVDEVLTKHFEGFTIQVANGRWINALRCFDQGRETYQRMPAVDASALPAKLDLRDFNGKNYVSPVKKQSPWGTCWSFGGIAAAETSIAYDNGHDYNNETDEIEAKLFDLSEKHLAWFTYTPLPLDNAAAGEIVSSVRLVFNGEELGDTLFDEMLAYSVWAMPEGGKNYFADAVAWAVEQGVTTGTGKGNAFRPYDPCTRAQTVTFLYRAYNGK